MHAEFHKHIVEQVEKQKKSLVSREEEKNTTTKTATTTTTYSKIKKKLQSAFVQFIFISLFPRSNSLFPPLSATHFLVNWFREFGVRSK